ncbi:unnamed protein product [Arabis nemorensis]|uniref:Uncharacterized protein n=1 Tax=Arabis nemorensis TaxID=586526 RepID=A0A565BKP1_9BRAS|nr:unnamed protein product [Arabis nemorensis]
MKNPIVDLELRVDKLIDHRRRDWNLDLLRELFFPADFNLIISHKPVISMADHRVWMHTKSGDYSVNSGYWLANQLKHADLIREASTLPSLNGIKSQVWNLKTSHKIKLFLWRVLSGATSVAENLAHRGMEDEANLWSLAQCIDVSSLSLQNPLAREEVKWMRPPAPWLKCNIGCSWSKRNRVGGFSWVLRNDSGVVLMHSRRWRSYVALGAPVWLVDLFTEEGG